MLPLLNKAVQGSGQGRLYLWKLSWTYDGGSAPTLDDSMSDRDERVSTPVAEAAAGVTTVNFPKCRRAWLASVSYEAATPGTAANNKRPVVSELNETAAEAGTCTVRCFDPDGTDPTDTNSGDRCTLLLLLEH